jgi:hypothetical protein
MIAHGPGNASAQSGAVRCVGGLPPTLLAEFDGHWATLDRASNGDGRVNFQLHKLNGTVAPLREPHVSMPVKMGVSNRR